MAEEQKDEVVKALRERLDEHNENRKTAQKEAVDGHDAFIKKNRRPRARTHQRDRRGVCQGV